MSWHYENILKNVNNYCGEGYLNEDCLRYSFKSGSRVIKLMKYLKDFCY